MKTEAQPAWPRCLSTICISLYLVWRLNSLLPVRACSVQVPNLDMECITWRALITAQQSSVENTYRHQRLEKLPETQEASFLPNCGLLCCKLCKVTGNTLGRIARNQKGICIISWKHPSDGNKRNVNTAAGTISLVGTKEIYWKHWTGNPPFCYPAVIKHISKICGKAKYKKYNFSVKNCIWISFLSFPKI